MDTRNRSIGNMIQTGSDLNIKLWRNNMALFVSLMAMIFALPVLPASDKLITRIILAMIVASGLYAAEFSKRTFRILFILGSYVICITVLNIFLPNIRNLDVIAFLSNTLFFIVVTTALVAHVARSKKVDRSTLLCAINSYMLIGLTASLLLLILHLIAPQSFNQVDPDAESFSSFLYFGFVTLTTLGYGDITPATPLARSMATFIALFGQLYLVIIMAMIIGKYLNTAGSNNNQHRDPV